MEKQKKFRPKYVKYLEEKINSGESVDRYTTKTFDYDQEMTIMIPNVTNDKQLLSRLENKSDVDAAIIIYEAFIDLEPIQAADKYFWTYLTHVDLYPYMIQRWGDVYIGKSDNPQKYIKDHWFVGKGSQSDLMRHSLSGLWWGVHMSIDENRDDKYELTRILFRQLDFATRTLGTYKLGRHKEAVIGILEFILENETLFSSSFEKKTRYITKHLNLIGGVKPLAYFDRQFFKDELEKVKKQIVNI